MYAEPPSQAEAVLASVKGLSFLSQVVIGAETSALPGHAQEPLQQSLKPKSARDYNGGYLYRPACMV